MVRSHYGVAGKTLITPLSPPAEVKCIPCPASMSSVFVRRLFYCGRTCLQDPANEGSQRWCFLPFPKIRTFFPSHSSCFMFC